MRVLVSWLREFVDVTATPEELGHTLSMRGFELSAVEKSSNGDAVLDFEILANRPDCLSVRGLAREAATAFSLPLKTGSDPHSTETVTRGSDPVFSVKLEAPDLCPRYSAAAADVTVG